MDRTTQVPNPSPSWVTEEMWDNITELAKIPPFDSLVSIVAAQNIFSWFFIEKSDEGSSLRFQIHFTSCFFTFMSKIRSSTKSVVGKVAEIFINFLKKK